MGTYLNPGKNAFEEAMNSEIFVDKTEMICHINSVIKTEQKYVCVSRPRRFGKSMAVKMLCAYYSRGTESRSLFEGCRVSQKESDWDKYLGKFDVIRLVMTDFFKKGLSVNQALTRMQTLVVRDLAKAYPEVDFFDKNDLVQSMQDVYEEMQTQFVIIIDEWDAIFREYKEDKVGQKKYLDTLRELLKDKDYVALAYMTGILPIKKYGKHSALNMFDEYSMNAQMQLAQYTGFTEDEVKQLCLKYEMEFDSVSDWYDGYLLTDAIPVSMRERFRKGIYHGHAISVYSPLSVVKAMRSGTVDNYWNKTETYEALADYIRMDFDGLKDTVALMMDGGRVPISMKTYQNDMSTFHSRDDILSLLIHLGYLGFEGNISERGIDSEHGDVFIPNKEILDEFKTSTGTEEWISTFAAFQMSQELLKATWAMDENKVAELLEKAHNDVESKSYNDEKALSYSVQLAYYAAQKYYTKILELATGKGYADIAYLPSPQYPDIPALLIELKFDEKESVALEQIYRQKYADRLKHYERNLFLIAISYKKGEKNTSPEFKRHRCRIVKA
ncbi:MAG: AAA family ATPase [Blautia sp.]|nr:AAA family ATPase [Blautia sp.]